MSTHRNAAGEEITARGATAKWAESVGFTRIEPAVPVGELKGQALDQALEDAGLSKSGTADEKRQRLADHEATDGSGESGDDDPDPQDPDQ